MRVRLESVGCRLNLGEIEAMARSLASAGHRVVGPGETADLCILNTCTVTAIASKKSRQLIRGVKRGNPDAAVIATGCDVEMTPKAAVDAGVDLVIGNADKDRLLEIADTRGLLREPDPDLDGLTVCGPGESSRTRAFVKVQDGCDNRCTFCVTTIARGAGRSVPESRVLDEIRELVERGYQEVVLSGVHLGSYGHDLGDRQGLRHLIEAILGATGVARLRLSSLEPWDLGPDFFEVFSDVHLLPHLHLPLQSGCDATLKRMARRTSRREFSSLVEAARRTVPDIAVSTDVIVGFPGENSEEFEESISFVEETAFSRLHIFRYSPRRGTLAAKMPGQVQGAVAQERSRRMHALGAELEHRFNSNLLGRTTDVLWETAEDLGNTLRWSGLTPNFVRVATTTPADHDLANIVAPTEIVEIGPGGLIGRVSETRD